MGRGTERLNPHTGLREAIPLVSQNVGVLALEDVPDFRATVEEAASL